MAKEKAEKRKVITTKEVVVTVPVVKVPGWLQGFTDFVREQGVVGLMVGFVLGTQVKTLVDQMVASFINPILGLVLPGKGGLTEKSFAISWGDKTGVFTYGAFLFQLITFAIVALVVYLIVRRLKLDRLDKKKA